jgi:hypothetical protein
VEQYLWRLESYSIGLFCGRKCFYELHGVGRLWHG